MDLKTDKDYNDLRMEFLDGLLDSEFGKSNAFTIYVKEYVDVDRYAEIAKRYFELNGEVEFRLTAFVINNAKKSKSSFEYKPGRRA